MRPLRAIAHFAPFSYGGSSPSMPPWVYVCAFRLELVALDHLGLWEPIVKSHIDRNLNMT